MTNEEHWQSAKQAVAENHGRETWAELWDLNYNMIYTEAASIMADAIREEYEIIMKTPTNGEEINNRVEWISKRVTLSELQKDYVHFSIHSACRDKDKEITHLQELLTEERRIRKGNEQAQSNMIAKGAKEIAELEEQYTNSIKRNVKLRIEVKELKEYDKINDAIIMQLQTLVDQKLDEIAKLKILSFTTPDITTTSLFLDRIKRELWERACRAQYERDKTYANEHISNVIPLGRICLAEYQG